MKYNRFTYDTPIGPVIIADNANGKISYLCLPKRELMVASVENETEIIKKAGIQLQEYFAGKRKTFDIPLSPRGTEFQIMVWKELCTIPYGTTVSYKELAIRVGKPNAARAVGMAMNKNPIALIAPCHRVVGYDGGMTGFVGGIELKRKLLRMEGAIE